MPRVGLVADGRFDQGAITILLRKCGQGITVESRQCGGRNISRALGILRELERRNLVDLAIWATDSETDDPRELERKMRKAVKDASLHLRVCCVSVVPMVEAWLLGDELAVQQICGSSRRFNNPETLPNPKAELRHLLGQRPYTVAVAERIAETANPETIAQRCPSFRKLRDCVSEASQPHRKTCGAVRKKRTKRAAPTSRKRPPNT
jgi:hypothetical protein